MYTAASSFSAFADAFGLDCNNVELYDIMIERLLTTCYGNNCKFIQDTSTVYDKIFGRKTLTARFSVSSSQGKSGAVEEYIVEIPVMIGSRYAPIWRVDNPNGGRDYACFVIDGSKYVLVSMDQRNFNEPYVHRHNTLGPQALYITHKYTHMLSISVYIDGTTLMVVHKKISFQLSEFIRFMSDVYDTAIQDIMRMFVMAYKSYTTSTKVFTYISSIPLSDQEYKELTAEEATRAKEGLTSIGTVHDHCHILAMLVVKVVSVCLQQQPCDDVDDEVFKRVEPSSTLVHTAIVRRYPQISTNNTCMLSLTGELETLFRTDGFKSRSYTNATGVSFEPEINTPVELLSCIRRVKTYMHEDIVQPRLRLLNPSHYGFLCTYETSESKSAGLSKSMASTAVLSLPMCYNTLEDLLRQHELRREITKDMGTPVFVDGTYSGWTQNPDGLIQRIVECKKQASKSEWNLIVDSKISATPLFSQRRPKAVDGDTICVNISSWRYVSAYRSNNSLCILVSEGRITRPMLRVENGDMWIEMVDMAAYKSRCVSAPWKWYEVYDNSAVGIAAGVTPLYNMTQAPRVTYQASMAKQAISVGHDKFNSTEHHEKVLIYPQRPLVTSDIGKYYIERYADYRDQNVVVAMMSDARNNEDALVVNADSVYRGLMRTCKIQHERIYRVAIKTSDPSYKKEVMIKNDKTSLPERVFSKLCFDTKRRDVFVSNDTKQGMYSCHSSCIDSDQSWSNITIDNSVVIVSDDIKHKLCEYTQNIPVAVFDDNGTVVTGIKLAKRDVIQTLLALNKINPHEQYRVSELHTMLVVSTQLHEDSNRIDITMTAYKSLEIGDKVETLHSQKSIVCSMVKGCYMPYTEDGIRPDFIVNPHSIPSRMTVSTLFVALLAREICIDGISQVVVPTFDGTISKLRSEMTDSGYVTLRCGRTGSILRNKVFVGILPYRALKHQIMDKSAARHTGNVDVIHGQPVPGRRNNGGSRMGNMEQRALEGHCASSIMLQRNRVQVGETIVRVCLVCGAQSVLAKTCIMCDNAPMIEAPTTQSYQVLERLLESVSVTQTLLP